MLWPMLRVVAVCAMVSLMGTSQQAWAWFGKEKPSQYVSTCVVTRADSADQFVVRGYGQGDSFAQAKTEALRDIAERISVQVSGSSVSQSSLMNGEEGSHFQSTARIETSLQIAQAQQLCADQGDPTGRWHVVFEFDTRSPVQQLSAALNRQYQGRPIRLQGNDWLLGSQLVNGLRAGLVHSEGAEAVAVPVALRRQHDGWYLTAGDHQARLAADDLLDAMHFPGTAELALTLIRTVDRSSALEQLQEAEQFSLRVDSATGGYLSVFNIYADGRVSVLIPNEQIQQGAVAMLPGGTLTYQAGLLERGKATRDVYLAVVTAERIQPGTLHLLRENRGPVTGEASYQLHQLFALLEDEQPAVASMVVSTLPN